MNKWINADALNFRFVHGRWDSRYVREDEVMNAPGPVTCEECEYWAKEKNRGGFHLCMKLLTFTEGDFFCKKGSKNDDGEGY